MTRSILYYITGHGFGHARRSAQVIAELTAAHPELQVFISTTAAENIFDDILSERVRYRPSGLDPGAIEDNALSVNPRTTAQAVEAVLRGKAQLLERELAFIQQAGIGGILADVPFLAGDVAEAAGLPCLAVSNFSWDWIYEPWLGGEAGGRALLDEIRASYARMATLLHLPFGGHGPAFREVIEVPLVVNKSARSRDQIAAALGLDGRDARPLVLLAQRGGFAPETLARAVGQAREFRFLCPQPFAGALPENVIPVQLGPSLRFTDLLTVCDIVLSKLGYGTVADCIAAQVAVLCPPRVGFREDELMMQQVPPYLRLGRIDRGDFEAGHWRPHLLALLESPAPAQRLAMDGAAVCARQVARLLA